MRLIRQLIRSIQDSPVKKTVKEMTAEIERLERDQQIGAAEAQALLSSIQSRSSSSSVPVHLSMKDQSAVQAQATAAASRPTLYSGGLYAGTGAASSGGPVPSRPPSQQPATQRPSSSSQGPVPIVVPDSPRSRPSQGPVPVTTQGTPPPGSKPKTPSTKEYSPSTGKPKQRTPSTIEYSPSTGQPRPRRGNRSPEPAPGSAEAIRRLARGEVRMIKLDVIDDIEQARGIAAAKARADAAAKARAVPPLPQGPAPKSSPKPRGRPRGPLAKR